MPIDLFGFSIGRKRPSPTLDPNQNVKEVKSFVPPMIDDAGYIDAGGYYGAYLDFEGIFKTESDYIAKYREMAMHPEVESAVEDICNEAVVYDDRKKSVSIILDNVRVSDQIKRQVSDQFEHLMRLLDFSNKGYEIFRRWFIDGKGYYHIIIDKENPKKGIVELRTIDARKIKKMVEVVKETDEKTKTKFIKEVREYYIYREKPGETTGLKLSPEAICYYHSGLFDPGNNRAISYLHKAIKPLNQLRMIEDAVVIYRISRAPERRIFYVDVGSLPKNKAEAYVRDLMNRYRNKLVYDATTGEIRDDKKFMSALEDYWLPRREGGKGTEIQTLDGGQNLGEMEDVDYFKKRLYQALNVPVSRLEADNGFNMGRSAEISRDEVKFYKFIERLRVKFSELFINLLRTQLVLKGVMSKEEFEELAHDVLFEYNRDNYFSELKETEIMKERLEMMREIGEFIGQFFSKEYVYKKIMKLTDEEADEMKKQIDKEREEDPPLDDEMGGPNARR